MDGRIRIFINEKFEGVSNEEGILPELNEDEISITES